MKSTSETGHVKNVAIFEGLISFCSPITMILPNKY